MGKEKETLAKLQKALDGVDSWRKSFGNDLGNVKMYLNKMVKLKGSNISSLQGLADDVCNDLHFLGTKKRLLGDKFDDLVDVLEAADKDVSADKRRELQAIIQKTRRMKKGAMTITGQISKRLGKLQDAMHKFSAVPKNVANAHTVELVKEEISKKYLILIDTGIKAMDMALLKDLQSVDKRLDFVFVKGSGQLFAKQKEILDLINTLSRVGTGIARARNLIESSLKPLKKLSRGEVATVDTNRLRRDVREFCKSADDYLAQSKVLRNAVDDVGKHVKLSNSKELSELVTLAGQHLRHATTLRKDFGQKISSRITELEGRLMKWIKAAGEVESKNQVRALKKSDTSLKSALDNTERVLIEIDKLLKALNAGIRKLD